MEQYYIEHSYWVSEFKYFILNQNLTFVSSTLNAGVCLCV